MNLNINYFNKVLRSLSVQFKGLSMFNLGSWLTIFALQNISSIGTGEVHLTKVSVPEEGFLTVTGLLRSGDSGVVASRS